MNDFTKNMDALAEFVRKIAFRDLGKELKGGKYHDVSPYNAEKTEQTFGEVTFDSIEVSPCETGLARYMFSEVQITVSATMETTAKRPMVQIAYKYQYSHRKGGYNGNTYYMDIPARYRFDGKTLEEVR